MNDWVFAPQLGVVLVVILATAASTIGVAFRSSRAGVEPSVKASFKKLQAGWFQLHVSIANQAPYALVVDELRRVKPRAARLMAPIKQVSTRKGEFQVWSHPTTDKATTSIPLDLSLGPHDARAGAVAGTSQQQITAWLFLPEDSNPLDVTLELIVRDHAGALRRYRVIAKREGKR
jgi:hypothetical protein